MKSLFAVASATAVVISAALIGTAAAGPAFSQDPTGLTTLDQRIVPTGSEDFKTLTTGPGESTHIVREEGVGTALPGRETTRTSLFYFGQLSDFQLADEESPARVEFIEFGPFSAAWRPHEAFNPQVDDAMIRQLNAFADASPVAAGDGTHRAMDITINTGDISDSQQYNETLWSRQLMEGGPINPGSGVAPLSQPLALGCAAVGAIAADAADPGNYTGVQDFDDYFEGPLHQYYDPDHPSGAFASWPTYPGLMDSAQEPFTAAGLDVPSYVTFGNHDALVQGNGAANQVYEQIATGCIKPMVPLTGDPATLEEALASLDPAAAVEALTSNPTAVAAVPPDPDRRFVSKPEYKQVYLDGIQADGHGFAYIDPAEESASGGAAGYYSWSPEPGIRFISLDTVSEAGIPGPSADGNIDDPQFQWLTGELEAATAADELVVLFSHHAIPSLTADVPDEIAPPCTVADAHGHDINPGCDIDPRSSSPIHLGADMEGLLHQYPHVVAWVAGHSHVNAIEPYPAPDGESGFWSIRVAAEADWPQQSRLLELFDNDDGTLSLFGTIVDHASPVTAPPGGTDASTMTTEELASVGRTISLNDPQNVCGAGYCGEGDPNDRNVELLIDDPRAGSGPDPGKKCANVIAGTENADTLVGTTGPDKIRGHGGDDDINARDGDDCVGGGSDNDEIRGKGGADKLAGGRGRDRVTGGGGADKLEGAGGRDVLLASGDGTSDKVQCGRGTDRAVVDEDDKVDEDCETVVVKDG